MTYSPFALARNPRRSAASSSSIWTAPVESSVFSAPASVTSTRINPRSKSTCRHNSRSISPLRRPTQSASRRTFSASGSNSSTAARRSADGSNLLWYRIDSREKNSTPRNGSSSGTIFGSTNLRIRRENSERASLSAELHEILAARCRTGLSPARLRYCIRHD